MRKEYKHLLITYTMAAFAALVMFGCGETTHYLPGDPVGGPAGLDGAHGAPGPAGATGSDGAAGSPGLDGSQGSTGATGLSGTSCSAVQTNQCTVTFVCGDGSTAYLSTCKKKPAKD